MSDLEQRAELRESLAGTPSRRRLVELGRLASALEATRAAADMEKWSSRGPHSILAFVPVRALLEFRRGDRAAFELDAFSQQVRVSYFVSVEQYDRLSTDVPTTATITHARPPLRGGELRVMRTFPLVRVAGVRLS